jgi:hypothetical protein
MAVANRGVWLLLATAITAASCGCEAPEGSRIDASRLDASEADEAGRDASAPDTGLLDSGAGAGCPVFGIASPATFTLASGAFPGSGHPDVAVHVPDGYDACREQGAIVFFHGFDNCVVNVVGSESTACTPGGEVRTAMHLVEQLEAVHVNAILIAVELRYDEATGDPGALANDGGLRALLDELYDEHLSAMLGRPTSVDDLSRIVLASHSGGYTALARGLDRGGVDVDEVELFDSLYGEIPTFQSFIEDDLARFDPTATDPLRFALVFTDGGGTASNSRALGSDLESRLTASGDPANLLFDDTTATLDAAAFEHPLIVKHSMLSHDGVVLYYFERFVRASGFAPLP